MTETEIYNALHGVFHKVHGEEGTALTTDTTAKWTSVNRFGLLVKLEKRFGVRCQTTEMAESKNVDVSTALLDQEIAGRG